MREWLKKLRIEKNMTQAEVGKQLGISESYNCLIESGVRQKNMDITILSKLSILFNTPFEKLVIMERGDKIGVLPYRETGFSFLDEKRQD